MDLCQLKKKRILEGEKVERLLYAHKQVRALNLVQSRMHNYHLQSKIRKLKSNFRLRSKSKINRDRLMKTLFQKVLNFHQSHQWIDSQINSPHQMVRKKEALIIFKKKTIKIKEDCPQKTSKLVKEESLRILQKNLTLSLPIRL